VIGARAFPVWHHVRATLAASLAFHPWAERWNKYIVGNAIDVHDGLVSAGNIRAVRDHRAHTICESASNVDPSQFGFNSLICKWIADFCKFSSASNCDPACFEKKSDNSNA
jgi:hypothetical protein